MEIKPIPTEAEYEAALAEIETLWGAPRIRESIIEGLNTPTEECADEVEW